MPNQYSEIDANPYNGWPNRSTWDIALHKGSDEYWQKRYEALVDRVAGVVGPSLTAAMGWKEVKSLYREVWEGAARGDGCIWKNIDWQRLKEHFLEDVDDAKRYPSTRETR